MTGKSCFGNKSPLLHIDRPPCVDNRLFGNTTGVDGKIAARVHRGAVRRAAVDVKVAIVHGCAVRRAVDVKVAIVHGCAVRRAAEVDVKIAAIHGCAVRRAVGVDVKVAV